ncbi:rod shape-determining protein MreC [Tenacibaculum larymnensis]|uniref:Cell shape-determining protein MreC n=1 Tax=Tenacibaculum larymnensis TaxID=2878201 RepID=A0A9X4ELX0_9FLAO|nr:rod shape-determining protein MreC [Tenacibaculum larymnensis]MDE1206449.1 rod shape-determining protein MreC [Tenacibaculum larymnensis]
MQQLIYFLQKYKYFLFFLFLEVIAVALIINNHSFHKSKFISSTNFITGGLYQKSSNISEYLGLKERNSILIEENLALKNKLEKITTYLDSISANQIIDTTQLSQNFNYISGKIIKNSFHKTDNFLTINRGKSYNVSKEMGVINSKGIIGITDNASNKYARVQSILNSKSNINAKFKNNNHYGTLTWDGKDYNIVQLTDIPRQAAFKKGDTVVTGGRSTIFPNGIPIGTVLEVPEELSAVNSINIKLFNDMSNLGHVYIITNLNKEEIKTVENNNE